MIAKSIDTVLQSTCTAVHRKFTFFGSAATSLGWYA